MRGAFVGDALLAVVAVLLLLQGQTAGWWLLVFVGVRAVVGAIALFALTPKLLARRDEEARMPKPER